MNATPAFDPTQHPRGAGGRFTHTQRAASGLTLDVDTPPADDLGQFVPPTDLHLLGEVDLAFDPSALPEPDTEFMSAHLPYDADPVNPTLADLDSVDPYRHTSAWHPDDLDEGIDPDAERLRRARERGYRTPNLGRWAA